jgi:hypothetical protein
VVQHWPQVEKTANFGDVIKLACPWGVAFALIYDLKNLPILIQAKTLAMQLSPAELELNQPQIFDMLSNFSYASVFAYQLAIVDAPIIFNYAPQPVALHAFAAKLPAQEFATLAKQPLFFLHALQSIQKNTEVDKVAKTLIVELAKTGPLTLDFFENFYQQYSRLPGFAQAQARLLFNDFNQLLT